MSGMSLSCLHSSSSAPVRVAALLFTSTVSLFYLISFVESAVTHVLKVRALLKRTTCFWASLQLVKGRKKEQERELKCVRWLKKREKLFEDEEEITYSSFHTSSH